MTQRFDGKVAVVTGGASGIGLAIVRRFIAEGGRAVIADVNGQSLGAVEAELGAAALPVELEVRDEAAVQAMVEQTLTHFGQLDCAFNCAGVNLPGELVDLDAGDWDRVLDICLKGTWLCLKHEARAMAAGGAIVNIASLNSHVPMIGGGAYACAKAGVEMLGRNAALELARRKIRVNTVSPGLTDTPLVSVFKEVPGLEAAFMDRIPLERWGTPEDMAAAALFLASDDAGYISGSNLFVDGAWETTGYPNLRPFLGAKP